MRNPASYLSYLSSIEALATAGYLLALPGDPKNSVLFGFSAFRLGMVLIMLAAAAGAFSLGLWARRNNRVDQWAFRLAARQTALQAVAGGCFILLLAGWGLAWLPSYRLGENAAYLDRARPLIAWLTLNILQVLAFLAITLRQMRSQYNDKNIQCPKSFKRTAVLIFAGIAVTALFMALTRTGLKPDQMLWNEPGVPLLGLQVLFAAGTCILAYIFFPSEYKGRRKHVTDILLFLAIWAAAGLVLYHAPAARTYFSPGPYPPNLETYPFSDAAGYDTSAQAALLGQGFGNFQQVDKPLISFFLFLLHLAAGENYNQILSLQAAVLAIFPAILFLLTRRLFNRAAGLTAALLLVIKELNSYAAGIFIQVSHSKLFLGELALAVVLALFAYYVFRWFHSKKPSAIAAMAAGGLLGLATLLRHNPWLLIPVFLVAALFRFRKEWKTGLKTSLLFLGVMAITILPWLLRTASTQGNPLYFLGPLKGVVWTGRFLPAMQPTPLPAQFTPTSSPIKPTSPSAVTAQPALILTPVPVPEPVPSAEPTQDFKLGTFVNLVSNHFFHNLAASALILPHSLVLDDLQHILKAGHSAWAPGWDGSLGVGETALLMASLALAAFGMAAAWTKTGMAGLVPLVSFAGYNLATAAARTSGGRYIVPVDWVLILYFAVGLAVVVGRAANAIGALPAVILVESENQDEEPASPGWKKMLLVAFCFLGMGSLIPLSELAVPMVYTQDSYNQAIRQQAEEKLLEPYGIDAGNLRRFIEDKQSQIGYGRILYPRYYPANEGEPDIYSANKALPYPRLVFNVAGYKPGSFVLPLIETPERIPPGSSVLVLGCRKSRWYTDALLLVILGPESKVFWRSPAAALKCPTAPPVCDNNGNCN